MREYREKGKLIWVNPSAVHYDREQVEWLLPHLRDLREGYYPPEPRDSGYVEIQHRITEHAPYEMACGIAGDIDIRLARTGLDRYLVEEKYCNGLSEQEITEKLYMDEAEVYRRIASAVSYIASGILPRWIDTHKRRGLTYREWVNNRRRQWMKRRQDETLLRR